MTRVPPFENPLPPELSRKLAGPDLRMIGLVLVRGPAEERTLTLWCDPATDPRPLRAQNEKAGWREAALILVAETGVTSFLSEHGRGVPWLERYVTELLGKITDLGFETFLRSVMTASATVGAGTAKN